ncbi:MAG: hypothetical protein LBH68_07070, partial [Bifidobacteriaceae bacterium]|nr:hypothetical protein [Bifidobacteriaceae bacterium]
MPLPLRVAVIPGAAPRLWMCGDQLPDAAASLPPGELGPVDQDTTVIIADQDLDGGETAGAALATEGGQWVSARAALPAMPAQLGERVLRALAVANWRWRGRFCPACGAPVEPNLKHGGWFCTGEGVEVFPRTDPCVITAVLDGPGPDGRLLLTHASNHAPTVYTLVA